MATLVRLSRQAWRQGSDLQSAALNLGKNTLLQWRANNRDPQPAGG
jgi:hypothetical protein